MKLFTLIIFQFALLSCFAQKKRERLIVTETFYESVKHEEHYLVSSYNFHNGVLISKDTIIERKENPKNTYHSINAIYKNRYVITDFGSVIDLKTKSLINDTVDNFIGGQGDSLIFHCENLFKGTGYLSLNLKTKSYTFLNNNERESEEGLSPDKKHRIYIEKSTIPWKITVKDHNGLIKVTVPNKGDQPYLLTSGQGPEIATEWLNPNTFIYLEHQNIYSKDGKISHQKINIRKHYIELNTDTIYATFDSISFGFTNCRFYRDALGQLIFCSVPQEKQYIVDSINNRLTEYEYQEYGNNFSQGLVPDKEGYAIIYNGQEIGKCWCNVSTTSNGTITLTTPNSSFSDVDSIKVWSSKTRKWTTIDDGHFKAVIGWADR